MAAACPVTRVPLAQKKVAKLGGSFLGNDVVSSAKGGFTGAAVSVKAAALEKKQKKAMVKAVVAEPVPSKAAVRHSNARKGLAECWVIAWAKSLLCQMSQVRPKRADPKSVVAVILGGGAGTRLFPLTKTRAKPAVSWQLDIIENPYRQSYRK